ncbi:MULTISPECIES: 5-oxoprolinase subunit PxpB [unclassified Rhizobium]|uniref:5-oxoprolinase subunit PxpB n=1 Tax=unclassified Rhizobium TaxID=2613769 RepID=UPI001ADA1344|nr:MULTISPECIES: 5-oxoprolinase subunit PxpB [unclassified Rhizobium]MBO9127313.1 5-oxoprolinase subunit PxpB [Rhizobium sp. 16-488-2b]MBO9177756.1 5-oxoprolinase subunit PxpB [Rhizobium sp. 16-488-2a]
MAMMQSVHPNYPRIIASGDSALVVEFSDHIDEETNERVIALADMLATRPITGVIETVPTYRSLLVAYDPVIIRGKTLSSSLETLLGQLSVGGATARRITVPVLYGEEVGIDLDELADMKQMSREELIALHASADYRVYMIGFAPGFSYLGGLPQQLHTPRLAVPRQRIEASAIGIGGKQASINSVPGPSGWRFIGRTPLRLFDPSRPQPFLLRAGDRVRFRPVDTDEAESLDAAVRQGEPVEEWETP